MVRDKYKDGKLVTTAKEHAQQLVLKRLSSGRKGFPAAVKRYLKRNHLETL